MYRIILIDDEPLILAGIASLICWEEHDCRIVGKATNGHDAIDMILETQPDIVIADIRMPVMNGLELIESCQEKHCEFAFIFLTNLEDFQLARQAVHLGAVDYTRRLASPETDLDACFTSRPGNFCHKLSLEKEQQNRFLYYINKITDAEGYGQDILEQTAFMELLVLLNRLVLSNRPVRSAAAAPAVYNRQVDDILKYINQNITAPLTIGQLAGEFYLSESYICRIFKTATGTTVNKYITARRISIAKALLSGGAGVTEAFEKSGFADYSNFFKSFTRAVGISPKKYAQCSVS